MSRRNKADDLDFEIHVDPSCLSDPMDDVEKKGLEDPVKDAKEEKKEEKAGEPPVVKAELETKAKPEIDASEKDLEHSEEEDDKKQLQSKPDTDNDDDASTKDESKAEKDQPHSQPELDDKTNADVSEHGSDDDADDDDAASNTNSLDNTHDEADLPKPTQTEPSWEDVESDEEEGEHTPVEDSVGDETIIVKDLDITREDDSVVDDSDAERDLSHSHLPGDDSHHEDSYSEGTDSRRESAVTDGSLPSTRRHSSRTEALIHRAARDIVAQIGHDHPRDSLQSVTESEGESCISRSPHTSARPSDAHMSVAGGSHFSAEDEERRSAGDNSSHHENEDDVFSDHSARSSVGSMSETEQKKIVEGAIAQLDRSPRISNISQYNHEDEEFVPTIRGTPRPAFRSPSSVKAIQMSSPPSSVLGSPRSSRRFPTVSRLGSPGVSAQYSPKKTPPRFKRNTPPLVLLHVTLLPLRWAWGDVLDHATTEDLSQDGKTLREAWRMLQDRMGDTTVERGILLPHPQNDYEILEERLLEALELPMRRRARILECGHYLGPSNEMTLEDSDSEDDDDEDYDRRFSRLSQAQKTHWCKTCRSDIRFESLGPGKIFRVKVYASNGLMKAGAWEACWKEMERVDVEIEPIVNADMEDELSRLEADQLRELEALEEQERLLEEEKAGFEEEKRAFEQKMLAIERQRERDEEQRRMDQEMEKLRVEEEMLRAEEEKLRLEEEKHLAEEEQLRAQQEERLRAEEEERRREEERERLRVEEEKLREEEESLRLEEEKARAEEEELRAEEEKFRVEEEALRAREQLRLDEERAAAEEAAAEAAARAEAAERLRIEEQKLREEEEKLRLEEEKARAEEEELRAEEEKLRLEVEKAAAEAAEGLRVEEEKLREEEEKLRLEEEKAKAEEEERHRRSVTERHEQSHDGHKDLPRSSVGGAETSRGLHQETQRPSDAHEVKPDVTSRSVVPSPSHAVGLRPSPVIEERQQRDMERMRDMYGGGDLSQQTRPRDSFDPQSGLRDEYLERSGYRHPSTSPRAPSYMQRETPPSPSAEAYARREERRAAYKSDSLPELLAEAFRVLLQDKKNLIIVLLSVLILIFALRGNPQDRDPRTFQTLVNVNRPEASTVTVTQTPLVDTAQRYIGAPEPQPAPTQSAVPQNAAQQNVAPPQNAVQQNVAPQNAAVVPQNAVPQNAVPQVEIQSFSEVPALPAQQNNIPAVEDKQSQSASSQSPVVESPLPQSASVESRQASSEPQSPPSSSSSDIQSSSSTQTKIESSTQTRIEAASVQSPSPSAETRTTTSTTASSETPASSETTADTVDPCASCSISKRDQGSSSVQSWETMSPTPEIVAPDPESRRETETVISERIVRVVETVTEVETATVKVTATETQTVKESVTELVSMVDNQSAEVKAEEEMKPETSETSKKLVEETQLPAEKPIERVVEQPAAESSAAAPVLVSEAAPEAPVEEFSSQAEGVAEATIRTSESITTAAVQTPEVVEKVTLEAVAEPVLESTPEVPAQSKQEVEREL